MFNLTSNVKKLHSLKILSETEYKLAIAVSFGFVLFCLGSEIKVYTLCLHGCYVLSY